MITTETENPSFEESWERYGSHVFAYILKWTKNRQIAEEITQNTAICAWKAWPRLQPGSQIKHWLITIASNQTRNYLLQTTRKPWHSLEETLERLENETQEPFQNAFQVQTERTPEEAYLQQEALYEILLQAFTCLPDYYREAFLLYTQGYSYREIAEKIHRPIGTCLSRIKRARDILAKSVPVPQGYGDRYQPGV